MESIYTILGMTCDHCVAHIAEEVADLDGVTGVQITLDGGQMVITSAAPIEFARVKEAVSEAGAYEVVPA